MNSSRADVHLATNCQPDYLYEAVGLLSPTSQSELTKYGEVSGPFQKNIRLSTEVTSPEQRQVSVRVCTAPTRYAILLPRVRCSSCYSHALPREPRYLGAAHCSLCALRWPCSHFWSTMASTDPKSGQHVYICMSLDHAFLPTQVPPDHSIRGSDTMSQCDMARCRPGLAYIGPKASNHKVDISIHLT